jgi:hypothetical protein
MSDKLWFALDRPRVPSSIAHHLFMIALNRLKQLDDGPRRK